MKKTKMFAGDTVTCNFEIVISVEKDCIYNEADFKEAVRDFVIGYMRKLCKKEYQFDD